MTTQFNGRRFETQTTNIFVPTFEGTQSRGERHITNVVTRRSARRDRRANRAI